MTREIVSAPQKPLLPGYRRTGLAGAFKAGALGIALYIVVAALLFFIPVVGWILAVGMGAAVLATPFAQAKALVGPCPSCGRETPGDPFKKVWPCAWCKERIVLNADGTGFERVKTGE